MRPAQVAAVLGVHVESVRLWVRNHKRGGDDALDARPHSGRPAFLTPDQESEVRDWLLRKPTEFGFRTDLWSAGRVAQLIRERMGVEFHPNYLREWLSKRGYSPQKPIRRAKQRNPEAIDHWLREDYPAVQKKLRPTTPTLC